MGRAVAGPVRLRGHEPTIVCFWNFDLMFALKTGHDGLSFIVDLFAVTLTDEPLHGNGTSWDEEKQLRGHPPQADILGCCSSVAPDISLNLQPNYSLLSTVI